MIRQIFDFLKCEIEASYSVPDSGHLSSFSDAFSNGFGSSHDKFKGYPICLSEVVEKKGKAFSSAFSSAFGGTVYSCDDTVRNIAIYTEPLAIKQARKRNENQVAFSLTETENFEQVNAGIAFEITINPINLEQARAIFERIHFVLTQIRNAEVSYTDFRNSSKYAQNQSLINNSYERIPTFNLLIRQIRFLGSLQEPFSEVYNRRIQQSRWAVFFTRDTQDRI